MNAAERRVEVGRVVAVHGVRGALKLESWTDPRDGIFAYRPWLLMDGDSVRHRCEQPSGHAHGKGLLAQLPDVDDRDAALALVGLRICVSRSNLPEPQSGAYYWTDLEGLAVSNVEGVELGQVDHLLATQAHDVLVLQGSDGRERLVPFVVGTYVKQVDLAGGRLIVDWDPEF